MRIQSYNYREKNFSHTEQLEHCSDLSFGVGTKREEELGGKRVEEVADHLEVVRALRTCDDDVIEFIYREQSNHKFEERKTVVEEIENGPLVIVSGAAVPPIMRPTTASSIVRTTGTEREGAVTAANVNIPRKKSCFYINSNLF